MQVCTSLQTDNHASTPPLSFYRPDDLPAAQETVSKHWRHSRVTKIVLIARMRQRDMRLTSMEVVVSRQRVSRHIDARLAALESRVAEVTNRLNLFKTQPSPDPTLLPLINSEGRPVSVCYAVSASTAARSNFCPIIASQRSCDIEDHYTPHLPTVKERTLTKSRKSLFSHSTA